LLEVVQHVLRAIGRPHCEEVVIVILEAAAATHGDESGVSDLGEDDLSAHSCSSRPSPVAGRVQAAANPVSLSSVDRLTRASVAAGSVPTSIEVDFDTGIR
jgi:hypothetical protein